MEGGISYLSKHLSYVKLSHTLIYMACEKKGLVWFYFYLRNSVLNFILV